MSDWDNKERRQSVFNEEEKKLLMQAVGASDHKFFGFKIQEITIIFSIFFGVFAFYLRTNDAIDRLVGITDYLVKFAQNSDIYHSTTIGIQFEQGKPINPDFNSQNVKPINKSLN